MSRISALRSFDVKFVTAHVKKDSRPGASMKAYSTPFFTIFEITVLYLSRAAGPTKKLESRLAKSLHSLSLLAVMTPSFEVEAADK